jgi:hypothetical protein
MGMTTAMKRSFLKAKVAVCVRERLSDRLDDFQSRMIMSASSRVGAESLLPFTAIYQPLA